MSEEVNTTKKHCAKCMYHDSAGALGGIYCDYLTVTGKIRPCPARHCTEYKAGKKKRGKPK